MKVGITREYVTYMIEIIRECVAHLCVVQLMGGTSDVWHIFKVIWDESGNVWHTLSITREYVTYMIEIMRECVAHRMRGTIDVWHI